MKKEEVLNVIETRIHDLDVRIETCGRSAAQTDKVEMWQFAKNELILVRDTLATNEECEV